ncbi:MAG: iron complex outermembrane recepter protein [Hyphomonadaceae bacterium]|nr:MAG: iron complex outermembrane recepter protein [Hyphomonadaceae bacterium]
MFFDAPPPPPPIEQHVIVVTASALSSSKDAINQGVIVLNREAALLNSAGGGIGETLAGQAGVRATFFGPNASRPIIRGLGEDRIRLLSNGLQGIDASTISPDHAAAVDGLEAQSIEVLKGATALRFGSNAVGGVVNIVDGRLPSRITREGVSGDFFAGLNPRDKASSLAGNISYSTDNFVFRLDGLRRQSGDYSIPGFAQTSDIRAVTGDDTQGHVFNSGGEIWVLGGGLGFIGDNARLAISARETGSDYGIPGEEANIELKQNRIDMAGALNFDFVVKELSFAVSNGNYSHAEIEHSGAIGTIFRSSGYEGRVEGRTSKIGNFEGVFGLQIGDRDFAAIGDEAFILPVNIKNNGAFAIGHFETEAWGSEFGIRRDVANYSGLAGRRNFDSNSASLSGFIKPMEGLRLALTLAQTTRNPTEVELFAYGPHAATQSFEIGDVNLRAETARSVELAAIYRAPKTNIELNFWRANFDDFVSFNPTGLIEDGLPVFQASQKDAELSGYELVAHHHLGVLSGAEIRGDIALDFVRGKYVVGGNIARMPPASVTFGLEALFANFTAKAEVQFLDNQNKIAQFETATNRAQIYNLEFNFTPPSFDKWSISAQLQNITDQEVREHTSVLKDYLPRPGRTVNISAHYRF